MPEPWIHLGSDRSFGTHPIPPIPPGNYTRIQHPNYNNTDWIYYDIGIIRLHSPIDWERYEPGPESVDTKHFIVNTVCLPQKEDIPSNTPTTRWEKASYYAFGTMEYRTPRSPFMQRGDVALKYGVCSVFQPICNVVTNGSATPQFTTEPENVPRICGVCLKSFDLTFV